MRLSEVRSSILFAGLFVFLCSPSHADDAPPAVSWKELCATSVCRATGHDGASAVGFSPDGRHLVVAAAGPDKDGLYLVERDGQVRFWTEGHSAAWLSGGNGIVFVRDDDLWTIEIGSKDATRLTNDRDDVRAPRPSPKGDQVVFASSRSGHQDLWLVTIDGSAPARQLTQGAMPEDEARFSHSWSPDGSSVAYYSNRADYWSHDLWLVEVDSQQARKLSTTLTGVGEPSWSPDGSSIAVYGTAKADYAYTELADLFVIDVESSSARALPMQIKAREPGAPAWAEDGSELFFPNHSRGDVELWRVPAEGGVATRITHGGGLLHAWDLSPQGDMFGLIRSTPTRGKEVDLLPARGGSLTQLTRFATEWPGLVKPEEISFRSWDGLYIQAFLFLVEQRLAQRGYVVLAVNYRGGSGFGRSFQDLSINDWANGQALDAAAAADFIRTQPWSSGKVGIYGYSYGGITSMAAVAREPEAFDAAVPMSGIYNFAKAYENADRMIQIFIRQGHGGPPEERQDIYAVSNTLAQLDAVKTPILLMHGENDTIAPFNQFQLASQALKRHGKVFEAHSYPGEPHRFRDLENRVDMYRRLEAWMDRWLKPD